MTPQIIKFVEKCEPSVKLRPAGLRLGLAMPLCPLAEQRVGRPSVVLWVLRCWGLCVWVPGVAKFVSRKSWNIFCLSSEGWA